LHFELAQLPELVAPFRVKKSLIIRSFKLRCIETWLFLVLALASSLVLASSRSSLPRPFLALILSHSDTFVANKEQRVGIASRRIQALRYGTRKG
jgi:hypothetical protein